MTGKVERFNKFVLCIVSPVLMKMVCGQFEESSSSQLQIDDVQDVIFGKAFDMFFGLNAQVTGFSELLELGLVADRFEMTSVAKAIENE
eukprot:CAMPEP_0113715802 /NCGR_PEP_ID=MMETSP0038_2-20120614/33488_1 /TAXON_ID=2898 /ORGANISM="Cryptomonas paramecium" /LENGTH=88 /DNA_ID=CAMNT_0000643157 /DNA_START=14 /DNA_END=277 /DNA_ORIENTATION=+ /assembly_acc=CAM_ASM_000170